MIVLLLFFCSGATALVYEVIWSKYLSLMLGSTVQAQTVVLAVFMGGLALGNRLFGARADRTARPLAIYGFIELAIGLYAFFFDNFYRWADRAFVGIGTGLSENSAGLFFLKSVLSLALLLGPTLLMGGTLPLVAAWLQRRSADGGRWSARFYSVNSLGAVFGAGLAGFVLVRQLGLVSALQVTALVNLLVGFTAVGLARRSPRPDPGAPALEPVGGPARRGSAGLPWSGALVALTGGVSMGLEVLASRSLALIFGASLQAFAIVLMAFILGIGLGGTVVASPRWARLQPKSVTGALLLGAAAWVGLLVLGITQWVEIYMRARTGLAASAVGYLFHQILASGMAMAVLGIPAGLIGAVLPLWIRTLSAESAELGAQVGRLLTWNTLGAVAGVLLAGFGLMPALGLRAAFLALVGALCAAACGIAVLNRSRLQAFISSGLGLALILAGAATGEGWRHVLSSGVFRMRTTAIDARAMEERRRHIRLLFYEDAPDATVSVEQGDGVLAPADLGLRINGKVDASSRVDLATQYLLAHLPMAARPGGTQVFVLGLGSGVTAGALLGHPVEEVFIAENCAPVIRAAHFFDAWNRDVLADRRVRVRTEDARTVLKLSPRRYDVLIAEPSNPWTVGVGSVFSREFYQLAASRLKEGGIMCQWFHAYEMSDDIVSLILRTFDSVFPSVELWDPGAGDIILLGALQPWPSSTDSYRVLFGQGRVRDDLEAIGLKTPEALWSRQLASQRTAPAIPGPGPVQSDAFPILEYEAPRAFFIGTSATLLSAFDERTWQAEVAPSRKREVLAALGPEDLASSFGRYASVNSELNQLLAARLHRAAEPTLANGRPVPSLFLDRSTTVPAPFQAPASTSPGLRRLLESEAAARRDPADWRRAVDQIEEALREHKAEPGAGRENWSPADFAAAAARLCSSHGDTGKTKEILDLGLRLDPQSPELHYLARILTAEAVRPGPVP